MDPGPSFNPFNCKFGHNKKGKLLLHFTCGLYIPSVGIGPKNDFVAKVTILRTDTISMGIKASDNKLTGRESHAETTRQAGPSANMNIIESTSVHPDKQINAFPT